MNNLPKVNGKLYIPPDQPSLPKIRLTEASPFTMTVVDFAIPLNVRVRNGNDRKVWLFNRTKTSSVPFVAFIPSSRHNTADTIKKLEKSSYLKDSHNLALQGISYYDGMKVFKSVLLVGPEIV